MSKPMSYYSEVRKYRRRHNRLYRAEVRREREHGFRFCCRVLGPTSPSRLACRREMVRDGAVRKVLMRRQEHRERFD